MARRTAIDGEVAQPEQARPRGYGGPAETAAIRENAINAVLQSALEISQAMPDKVDIHDLHAVQERAAQYTEMCLKYSILPSMEGFSAACGFSRQWLYKFLHEHSTSPTAEFINRLRTTWTASRIAAAERGAVSEAITIFLLSNSNEGFVNGRNVTVTQEQPTNPLDSLDEQAARQRILESLATEEFR